MLYFAFDLDSTITTAEMFPRLAAEAGVEAEMRHLTDAVLSGEHPLGESLLRRVELLATVPLSTAHKVLASIPLDRDIEMFIRKHRERCAVITANLDLWIAPVMERLGCRAFTSRAVWEGNRVRLIDVVDKRAAARQCRNEAGALAATGDSAADVPMLQEADYRFAHAGVHMPPPCLRAVAHAVTANGADLCGHLETLLRQESESRENEG